MPKSHAAFPEPQLPGGGAHWELPAKAGAVGSHHPLKGPGMSSWLLAAAVCTFGSCVSGVVAVKLWPIPVY